MCIRDRGTTDKELPVDVEITYTLDGKEVAAKDLKGKDGKLEMKVQYTNKSKETVDVSGESVEMYTPFAMVTAMMLPSDEYTLSLIHIYSTTGMTSAMDGSYDIGMASRELKDEETAELDSQVIATDGIAVIVNKANTTDELSSDQVKAIYTGKTLTWDEVVK